MANLHISLQSIATSMPFFTERMFFPLATQQVKTRLHHRNEDALQYIYSYHKANRRPMP